MLPYYISIRKVYLKILEKKQKSIKPMNYQKIKTNINILFKILI